MPQRTFDRLYRTAQARSGHRSSAGGRRVRRPLLAESRGDLRAGLSRHLALVEHASAPGGNRRARGRVLRAACKSARCCYAPMAQAAPSRRSACLLHEVRTSFYRKLFLVFVAVAVVPVVVAAVAFGGYMTARFQADVEHEAATTVDGRPPRLSGTDGPGGERRSQRRPAPTDDVMVWIRQVIDHDVNYFEGSGTGGHEPARSVRLRLPAHANTGDGLPRVALERRSDARRRGKPRRFSTSSRPPRCRRAAARRDSDRAAGAAAAGTRGANSTRCIAASWWAPCWSWCSRRAARRVARRPGRRSGRAAHARHAADRRGPARRAYRDRHGRRTAHASSTTSTAWRRHSAPSAPSWRAPISSRRGTRWRGRWRTKSRTRSRPCNWPPNICSTSTRIAGGHSAPIVDQCVGDDLEAGAGCCGRSRRSSRTSRASRRPVRRRSGPGRCCLGIVDPYRAGLAGRVDFDVRCAGRRAGHPGRPDARRARADQSRRERGAGDAVGRRAHASRGRRSTRQSLAADGGRHAASAWTPRGARARVRAVLLDQDGRLGPGPGQRETEHRARGRHRRDLERARQGTTVTVTLPLAAGRPGAGAAGPSPSR